MLAFFSFMVCALCDLSEESLSNLVSQIFSSMFFSKFNSFSFYIYIYAYSRFNLNIISSLTFPGSGHQIFLLYFSRTICIFISEYLIVIIEMSIFPNRLQASVCSDKSCSFMNMKCLGIPCLISNRPSNDTCEMNE